MKRLTSILLALLMLVGMALAEETPDDAVLGNWYGLNAQTIIRLTLKEDGEFKLVVGYLRTRGAGSRRRRASIGWNRPIWRRTFCCARRRPAWSCATKR